MNTSLISAIVNSDALPSIPVVAFKVLELSRREDVDIDEVVEVIGNDPALTAKMMKVSNSSMFGMSKQVSSLKQAMVVLGMRTVKIMALGFSLVEALNDKKGSGFDYAKYWRRSLSTAVAARNLAGLSADIRKDEAFVGGLLCDVGMVAAARHPNGVYKPVLDQYEAEGGNIQDIEREILGVTHAQISAMMLSKWSMPEILAHATAGHHGDEFDALEPRPKKLAAVLWAASEVAELFCGDKAPENLDAVRNKVIELVHVPKAELEKLMADLNGHVRESAELFKLNVSDELSFDQIRQAAVMQMTELSISAEHEREQTATQLKTMAKTASTDQLTGVPNRRAFDEQLSANIEHAKSAKGDLGLIMLDIDHFKKFNDTYGHLAGDEVLKLVGKSLGKISDATQFAARYGGEEFAIIVANATARQLRELAEDVRKNIARLRLEHDGAELSLTASLGAAHVSFAEESIEPNEFISRADACLYEAKRDGRNRVEITF